jgi:hypothetical protein
MPVIPPSNGVLCADVRREKNKGARQHAIAYVLGGFFRGECKRDTGEPCEPRNHCDQRDSAGATDEPHTTPRNKSTGTATPPSGLACTHDFVGGTASGGGRFSPRRLSRPTEKLGGRHPNAHGHTSNSPSAAAKFDIQTPARPRKGTIRYSAKLPREGSQQSCPYFRTS